MSASSRSRCYGDEGTEGELVDDATHARMDGLILETVVDAPTDQVLAAFLLAIIVDTSEGRLDPKYKQSLIALDLLREHHPDLEDLLKEAWKENL